MKPLRKKCFCILFGRQSDHHTEVSGYQNTMNIKINELQRNEIVVVGFRGLQEDRRNISDFPFCHHLEGVRIGIKTSNSSKRLGAV